MTILLPIKNKYSEAILNKEKSFEIRRNRPKEDFSKIVIYTTSPIMKITGHVEVIEVIEETLENLWKLTKEGNHLTKKEFDDYFKGRTKGYAFRLGKTKKYSRPKKLDDFNVNFVPQGFIYLNK